jgi:hypothetical protein
MTTPSAPPAGFLRCALDEPSPGLGPALVELRGLSVVLLVLYYVAGMLGWSASLNFQFGVDLLLVVSGITLACDLSSRRPAELLAAMTVRFVPAYWIVLTLFLASNTHFLQLHYTPLNVTLHYLGLQEFGGDGTAFAIVEPLCLVALLFLISVLFILGHRLLAAPDRLLLAGAAAALPLLYAFSIGGQAASFSLLGRPLLGFFLGLLMGRMLTKGRLELKLGPFLALALFVWIYVPYTQGMMLHTAAAGLSLMGLYLLVWRKLAPPLQRKWGTRCLGFVGDHWLEVLIIYQPLIREYNYYLQGRWFGIGAPAGGTLFLGIVAGLIATTVASVALHRLVRTLSSLCSIPL